VSGLPRRPGATVADRPADPGIDAVQNPGTDAQDSPGHGDEAPSGRGRWTGGRRVVLLAGVVAGVAALLAGTGWLFVVSSVLDVRSVQVEGTRAVTPARVLGAAAVPTGGPLALVDTRAAAGRVLELPGVADVVVGRRFPHTVTVRVTERVPIAVLSSAGGQTRLLDADATVWVPPGPVPAGLPVLWDRNGTLDARAVGTAVQVWTSLPAALHTPVTALVAASPVSVLLVLRDGRVIVWGSPAESAAKSRVATALLGATKARYVDVSTPAAPVTRSTVPAGLIPSRGQPSSSTRE
jgi:cell division protein FtsQ